MYRLKNTRGQILPIVLVIIIGVLTLVGTVVSVTQKSKYAVLKRRSAEERYFVTDLMNVGRNRLRDALENNPDFLASNGATDSFSYTYTDVRSGSSTVDVQITPVMYADGTYRKTFKIPDGKPYAGLNAYARSFQISCVSGTDTITRTVDLIQIPIWQFAIFYNHELRMYPGANMTINGRVHANGNIYLQPNNNSVLTFVTNSLTAARMSSSVLGDILTVNDMYPDPATTSTQTVNVSGRFGSTDLTGSITSTGPSSSIADKLVTEHAAELKAPNPDSILSFNGKWASKYASSCIVREDANALKYYVNSDGHNRIEKKENEVFKSGQKDNVVKIVNTGFYDAREKKTVSLIQIDLSQFYNKSNYFDSADSDTEPDFPLYPGLFGASAYGRKVIYIDAIPPTPDSNKKYGVRLINGNKLEDSLTIVTNGLLYVCGDYNTVAHLNAARNGEKGLNETGVLPSAGLIADAITVLSTSWQPDNSSTPGGNYVYSDLFSDKYGSQDKGKSVMTLDGTVKLPRNVGKTGMTNIITINAAMLCGAKLATDNSPRTADTTGGFNNYVRLLEDWSANTVTLKITGSFVSLWGSTHSGEVWRTTADSSNGKNYAYFSAPIRDWRYDNRFDDPKFLPPGTPQVTLYEVKDYQDIINRR